MTSVEMYCPKDFNLGDYRDDHCNVGGIPCPEPKPVDPEQVVQVSCGPCGRFWGIPIDKIMKGKAQAFHSCALSECAAKVIVPQHASVQALVERGEFAPSPDLSNLSYGQGEATPVAPTTGKSTKPRK